MSTPDRAHIRAVLFDFDGVIADTESVHFQTFSEILTEEGIVLGPDEDAHAYMGIQDRHAFRKAFEDHGRELDDAHCEALVERKSDRYELAVAGIPLLPGVEEMINDTLTRFPATIASGGRRRDIEAILRRTGLIERFGEFITGDDVRLSKPAPDCFLAALEILRRLGSDDLAPEECLVFEDSFRGVEGAKTAGMYVVALTNSYPAERLRLADEIIDSFGEFRW